MRRSRFSKFVGHQKKKTRQSTTTYSGKSFLSRIAKSLNESGYRLSKTLIVSTFIIYLLVFFFAGYSLIAPLLFRIPSNITVKEIVDEPQYSNLKENLLKAGLANTHIVSTFYKGLWNDVTISKALKDKAVSQNAKDVSNAIQNVAFKTIEATLGIKEESLPPFKVDVSSLYENIQKDKNINSKKSAFLISIRNDFLNYLSNPPVELRLIELSKRSEQGILFKLAFGFIFAFEGLLIFFAFISKPLEEMSLSRLKEQIPPWLQMLTNSIQAGNSLSQALEFSQEKIKSAPLSGILKEITARYVTYKNLDQALEPLNKWTDRIPELKNVISALVIQEKMGGNLIPVLYSISNLFSKRTLVMQKIESLASEATGQLKIIFVMFFFIILIAEAFMKSFNSPLSPVYMFFSKGGGIGGFLNLSLIHITILVFSYALYKGGEVIVKNEMKF